MKQLFAVWLAPQDNDKEYLQNIVNDLAVKYNAPKFIPHLTILGDTIIELEDLKKAIDNTFLSVKPFKIKTTKISQSDIFFKTLFAEFEKNDLLTKIFSDLEKNLPEKTEYIFNPHISLLYKNMPEKERIRLTKEINLKNTFTIDKVIINAPKNGDNDFLNIEGWQSAYTKILNY